MEKRKCSNPDCTVPDGKCINLHDNYLEECGEYLEGDVISEPGLLSKTNEIKQTEEDAFLKPVWTGEAFKLEEINLIGERSNPIIIGLVGAQSAGKTSFLGVLFLLLSNHYRIKEYDFAGSYTLVGWERQANALEFGDTGISYSETTPNSPDFYSFYHLALKKDNHLKEILLADISGEGFSLWASDMNNENVKNVRWLDQNANAFVLFIDCVALIEQRGEAVQQITEIAFALSQNLNQRPLIVVWSKADRMEEIPKNRKTKLKEELNEHFKNGFIEIEITNHPKDEADEKCFVNNIGVIEQILESYYKPSNFSFKMEGQNFNNDFFLQYGQ